MSIFATNVGDQTLSQAHHLRITVPRSAIAATVAAAEVKATKGVSLRLTDQEEQQLLYYNRLRSEFIAAEQALPEKLKKKRRADEEEEYDVQLVTKKKKVNSANQDARDALLMLAETVVSEEVPEPTDFEAKMRAVAEQVFRGDRLKHEQEMLSDEALTLLVGIAREFFLDTVPVTERLAYFLRRVLASNLFASVVQRYEPLLSDIRTREEAADCHLVIVQNSHVWFDICAFTLYP